MSGEPVPIYGSIVHLNLLIPVIRNNPTVSSPATTQMKVQDLYVDFMY